MQDHHIAAHTVAAALRTIADALPRLSAQGSDPLYNLLSDMGPMTDVPAAIRATAEQIEGTAPFEPVTYEQKQVIFEQMLDEARDFSTREIVRDYLMPQTEVDWRIEADYRIERRND